MPGSGTDGRHDLPGEHGFRFFPGFYGHRLGHDAADPVQRARAMGCSRTSSRQRRVQVSPAGAAEVIAPAHLPDSLDELRLAFRSLFAYATELGPLTRGADVLVDRLLLLLTPCEERRFNKYKHQSWWVSVGPGAVDRIRQVPRQQAHPHPGRGQGPRDERPHRRLRPSPCSSTSHSPAARPARVSTGQPTTWIDPWLARLRSLGVDFRSEHQVQAIHCADGRFAGVSAVAARSRPRGKRHFYVAALPVEVMRLLVSDELKEAEPRLAGLHRLAARSMNGIMLYLNHDVPLIHGHTLCIDSPWLSRQYRKLGSGRCRGGDG